MRSDFSGLRYLLGGADSRGRVGMVRQFIAMGMGMGIMTGSQCRFYLGTMSRMRIRVIHGMMMFLLLMTFLVLA